MDIKDIEKLTNLQKDALEEISNITSGNATLALSQTIEKNVEVQIPKAEFLTLDELTEELGGIKKVAMSIYLKVEGDVTGQSIFVFEKEAAMKLVNFILKDGREGSSVMDSFTKSAFGEMANIFTAAYLNALAKLLNLRIIPDVPVVASDYVGPMVEYVFGRVDNPGKKTLCFSTKIKIDGELVNGSFICILDKHSLQKVIDGLESICKSKVNN
ncbi:MAG: chemotaxis protein CheC [Nanoarchaeota archaeon]